MKNWTKVAMMVLAVSGWAHGEFTVVIDPGHGGQRIRGVSDGTQKGDGSSSNNATSATGKHLEKDLTLEFSKAAAKALRESPQAKQLGGVKVVLTREDDSHVAAMMRGAIAVQHSADVFLSIHFNAFKGKSEGTRGYYCAATHPRWEYMHFSNPYAKRDKAFSLRVAQEVATALKPLGGSGEASAHGDDSLLKDGIRALGYARMDTHMYNAAVTLLEVEFIDNRKVEGWLLKDESHAQEVVGEAIAKAVCDYLAEKQKWDVSGPLKSPDR